MTKSTFFVTVGLPLILLPLVSNSASANELVLDRQRIRSVFVQHAPVDKFCIALDVKNFQDLPPPLVGTLLMIDQPDLEKIEKTQRTEFFCFEQDSNKRELERTNILTNLGLGTNSLAHQSIRVDRDALRKLSNEWNAKALSMKDFNSSQGKELLENLRKAIVISDASTQELTAAQLSEKVSQLEKRLADLEKLQMNKQASTSPASTNSLLKTVGPLDPALIKKLPGGAKSATTR